MRKFLRVSFFVFSATLLATAQIKGPFIECDPNHQESSVSNADCLDHECLTASDQAASSKDDHDCPQHSHSQSSCPQGHCLHHANCAYMLPAQSLLANSPRSSLHFSRIEDGIPSDYSNQLLRPPCA